MLFSKTSAAGKRLPQENDFRKKTSAAGKRLRGKESERRTESLDTTSDL